MKYGERTEAGVLVRPGVRQRLVPHFPYVVLYAADSAESVVVAVAHTSRQQEYRVSRWEVREFTPFYLPAAA